MLPSSVLIIGAGPTGMTAAIELKRFGFDVRIIDKADHMARHSQALVVQARTLEQFQRYGIAAAAVARGRKLKRANFWSDGKEILSVQLERIPSRYPYVLFLPQSETEALLNEHMEGLGVKTERQVELISLTPKNGAFQATIRHPDGTSEELSPRWILGCDGAHSRVREMTGTPFEGGGVGLSFFLGDLEIDGPDAPTDELVIHLHHGDVVFMGRLSDRIVRLIVAMHDKQGQEDDRPLTLADFQRAVDEAGVRVTVRSSEWMTPFHVNDRQAKHYRSGNAFLAGDASHIHSPVGGQGMNTGIQDVANLAWKLAAVARGADDSLLDSYEEERGAVGKSLLKFTERGLKMATLSEPLLTGARDALLPLISKLHPIQQAAMGFISETSIEYRSSSIVADHGGDGELRAGDRMPDLGLTNGSGASTLLQDWTAAKHRAILLDGSEAESGALQESFRFAEIVRLSVSSLDDAGRKLLGSGKKLIIVRPDGYVGFRAPLDNTSAQISYARQDCLA